MEGGTATGLAPLLPRKPPVSASHIYSSVCFSQSESEEKVVTYDHIGPNVCMGDHKVTDPCGGGGGWWAVGVLLLTPFSASWSGFTDMAESICV